MAVGIGGAGGSGLRLRTHAVRRSLRRSRGAPRSRRAPTDASTPLRPRPVSLVRRGVEPFLKAVAANLMTPVHGSTLGIFRMGLAINMLIQNDKFSDVFRNFQTSTLVLPYAGLGFFLPLDRESGDWLLQINRISLYFLLFGLMTRGAAVVNWLSFTYLFSICESNHNNHYILLCHVTFLVCFIDMSWGSLDRELWLLRTRGRRRRKLAGATKLVRPPMTVPHWHLLLMQLIMSIPYFFGAIAKMNPDWALRSQPPIMWFAHRSHWIYKLPYYPTLIALGGIGFDLTIVPILFSKYRYVVGFPACLFFNAMNKFMFNIGIFPYVMVCSLVLFMPPAFFVALPKIIGACLLGAGNDVWTQQVPDWLGLGTRKQKDDDVENARGSATVGDPLLDGNKPTSASAQERDARPWGWLTRKKLFVLIFMGGFAAFHVAFPLRHFVLYHSDPSWTEEGHFSAWHMMLRSKRGDAFVRLFTDEQEMRACEADAAACRGAGVVVRMEDDVAVAQRQMRKITTKPHAMLLWLGHLRRVHEKAGKRLVGAHVDDCYSLNARRLQRQTIPQVNLMDYVDHYEIMGA